MPVINSIKPCINMQKNTVLAKKVNIGVSLNKLQYTGYIDVHLITKK